jgi:outer membrane protein assembly factor BamB
MTLRAVASNLFVLAAAWLLCGHVSSAASPEAEAIGQAHEILDTAGVRGGLIVHLGCGDGRLTAALRAGEGFLVHGLDADVNNVAAARDRIRALGHYGEVSVEQCSGSRLPYADNMVNLLVAEDLGQVPPDEALRVLVPGGVLCVKKDGRWTKTVKPVPADIDQWSHFLHGADGNAVAHDARVGPPRRMQWVVEPLWSRGHEMVSSVGAMVSAGGRIFYVVDEGQPGVYSLPSEWFLAARDAFNGVLLWKRPLPYWSRGSGGFGKGTRPRCLVAAAGRVFLPLGEGGVLTALDAATGQPMATLDEGRDASEILCGDKLLLAVARSQDAPAGGDAGPKTLFAARPDTLDVIWQMKAPWLGSGTLTLGSDRVVFKAGEEIVALDAASGAEAWRAVPKAASPDSPKRPSGTTLVVHGGNVYCLDGSVLTALSARDGRRLWQQDRAGSLRGDLFAADGLIWRTGAGAVGHDPATGEVRRTIDASAVQSKGHHTRCYRSKATDGYLITPNRGAEFVSLTSDEHARNDWVRGICGIGVMPANGLLYAPPCQCFCYGGVMVTGFKALAPAAKASEAAGASEPPDDVRDRLERGPAYEAPGPAAPARAADSDWPMYRGGPERFGSTAATVSGPLRPVWEASLGGRLTPPVVAGGTLLVAAVDAYTLHAFDAGRGRPLWSFTAGSRIDSPPTVYQGLVLFGSADGWVYCLRASDGALAWRFRAAPGERRIGAFGRLESAWPVHGSVLVLDGVAYATAGRSTYLDGGIRLVALDPRTGRRIRETRLSTTQMPRQEGDQPPFLEAFHIEGTRSDLLVSDGHFIYLGQIKLDKNLAVQPAPYVEPGPAKTTALDLSDAPYVDTGIFRSGLENRRATDFASLGVLRGPMGDRNLGRHMLSTGGFLDDTWFNRTYWMYAENWPGYYIAHLAAKAGQLLSVDATTTYGVQAYPSRNIHSPTFKPGGQGYLLFADDNDNEPVLDDRTRNRDKGMGYTRSAPPRWFQWVPVRVRAMVAAGDTLFVAGPPDVVDADDPYAAFEGRRGAVLWAVSAGDGKKLSELRLEAEPVFDGLIAAEGRLFMTTRDGKLLCLGGG